ncbi:MAG: T9SS C-terminal target domain-containing protein [Saprospirales bacterium]|nr:MAG: T9SS C-terminal target domain-containing protein [Saprospirales bacterium]
MKIYLFLLILFYSTTAIAQINDLWLISSFGLDFKNDHYQISSSAGEFVIETFQSGDYILTQGFHQTFDMGTVVAEILPDLELMVYPNPFTDILLLKITDKISPSTTNLEIVVSDLLGRLIHYEKPNLNTVFQHQINTHYWNAGFYLLSIRFPDLNTEKTFKLIKN